MIHRRETKNILLWGDSGMTMNTAGELIFSMEVRIVYYFWKLPVWRTIKYLFGTEKELENEKEKV